jgi:hypothetical protein
VSQHHLEIQQQHHDVVVGVFQDVIQFNRRDVILPPCDVSVYHGSKVVTPTDAPGNQPTTLVFWRVIFVF